MYIKQTVLSFFLVIAASSCNDKMNKTTTTDKQDSISISANTNKDSWDIAPENSIKPDSSFRLKTMELEIIPYKISVKMYSPVDNPVLEKSIYKELRKMLAEHLLFLEKPNSHHTIEELIDINVAGFQKDSIPKAVIEVDPLLYHNEEITSIVYQCYNSLGGSLNTVFSMCHVFRNSNGQRLFFSDIVKPEFRKDFFRIAYSEWEKYSSKKRWYNPFTNAYYRDEYEYDDAFYDKELKPILSKNFYFTEKELILCYNLYGQGSEEYGKTSLPLSCDSIGSLLQFNPW